MVVCSYLLIVAYYGFAAQLHYLITCKTVILLPGMGTRNTAVLLTTTGDTSRSRTVYPFEFTHDFLGCCVVQS